jgi:hypothetical protein
MRLSSSQGNLHFILDKLDQACHIDIVVEYLLAIGYSCSSILSWGALRVLVLDDLVDSANESMFES